MKKIVLMLIVFLGVAASKDLGLAYEQLKDYANADFKEMQSKYKMPNELQIDSNTNSSAIYFDDKAGITIELAEDNQIKSINAMVSFGDDIDAFTYRVVNVIAVISAADGKNGNLTVGGDLFELTTKTLDQFFTTQKTAVNTFKFNNKQYGVVVIKDQPLLTYVQPVK